MKMSIPTLAAIALLALAVPAFGPTPAQAANTPTVLAQADDGGYDEPATNDGGETTEAPDDGGSEQTDD